MTHSIMLLRIVGSTAALSIMTLSIRLSVKYYFGLQDTVATLSGK